MTKMAKVSDFLRWNAWLPKLCAWLLLIFWAAQGCSFVMWTDKDRREKATWNKKVEKQAQDYLDSLADQIGGRAEKLGTTYRPEHYWNDLVWVEGYRLWLNQEMLTHVVRGTRGISVAHNVLENNERKKIYAYEEIIKQRSVYETWSNKYDPEIIRRNKISYADSLRTIYSWFLTLYVRGILLVLFLYLIRMHASKGILKSILSDKKRFVYSLILWPAFINKYPTDIINEVLVEAELRRMGNAFRRLSDAERKLVETIANSAGYRDWVVMFRAANHTQLQRSFLCALLLVLVIHMFLPTLSSAQPTDPTRAGPMLVVDSSHGQNALDLHQLSEQQSQSLHDLIFAALTSNCDLVVEEVETVYSGDNIFLYFIRLIFSIDHVPLAGCLAYREV